MNQLSDFNLIMCNERVTARGRCYSVNVTAAGKDKIKVFTIIIMGICNIIFRGRRGSPADEQ